MVAFVVPVGHVLGPSYTEPGAAGPDSYDVRISGDICYLDDRAYTIWTLAHGLPELVEHRALTRAQIEERATEQGISEPETVFDQLVEQGLLVQLMPIESPLRQFATDHRACALGLGMGNTPEEPENYVIGIPDNPWAVVDYRTYFIWSYMSHFSSLWDAVTEIADYQTLVDENGVPLTPVGILSAFAEQFPMLLATNCVYFDGRA